jgi:crossover junction endodeoxyribonuclease RuvC
VAYPVGIALPDRPADRHQREQMIFIGIDPGKRGAIVGLGPDGAASFLLSNCYAGADLVPALLMSAIHEVHAQLDGGPVRVAVEIQQAMPRQGLSSTFRTGANYGRICGVVEAMNLPLELLRPAAWRKHARRRLPELDLTPGRLRVPHDGIADAAGLALAAIALVAR